MSNAHMKLGPEYFRLIAHFERGPANDPNCRLTTSGAALDAYLCPADVATIGAGSIRRLDGAPVQMGDSVTEEEIFLLAERDAEDAADAVRKIERPLKQFQFEALTAFTHNLGAGNLRKIAPLIEAGRWEDAAEKMWEYVRAWGKREGKWYYQALLGLRIRRAAEALHLLGLPWSDVCDADNIGMPRKRVWQSDGIAKDGTRGRYFDELLPGATEFTTLEDMARASLVLNQPAPALASPQDPAGAGNGAGAAQSQPVQPPVPPKASATASGSAAGATPVRSEVNVPPPAARPAPAPVPPPKPVIIAPQPINPNALPTNADTSKNMADSTRMLGMVLVAIGSVIQVVTLRLGIGTAIGAVFFDLTRDPVVITLTVTAIVAALGWVTKRNGKKTFAKGADQAQGALH